jgi:hypothetical protein
VGNTWRAAGMKRRRRASWRLAIAGASGVLTLFSALPAGAAFPPVASAPGVIEGNPITFLPAPRNAAALPGQTRPQFVVPYLTIDPDGLRAAKLRAAQALVPSKPAAGPQAVAPAGPPVEVVNAAGLSADDEGRNATPPDTTGAIGPLHYVEFVNSLVGVYDRTLVLVSQLDLATFAGFPGGNAFDPQILWDNAGNRWFYAADVGMATLAVGWSKTADPSDLMTGWCQFFADTGALFHDFPKLGKDNNFMLIGTNVFSGPAFVTSGIWAMSKPAAGDASCTPPNATLFGSPASPLLNADGTRAFTPVPANTTDSSATGYIVAAHNVRDPGLHTKVMTWHMVSSAGTPSLVADGDITVGAFADAPDVPQPGTPFLIDTGDARLTQAVGRADPDAGGAQAVWTQHTIATPSGRSAVRWYEFLPGSRTVRQQGTVDDATDYIFNGAISPSSAGNDAAIFYNRASGTLTPVIGAQSRTTITPLGSMDPGELLLATSVDADQDFSCNPPPGRSCRWGDYAAATPDPTLIGTVWGTSQVTGLLVDPVLKGAQWTTQNFAVTT